MQEKMTDTLSYAETFDKYLSVLTKSLKAIVNKRVRLNIRKCDLFSNSVSGCGREMTRRHWQVSPKYFDTIIKPPEPKFHCEVAQLIYLVN